MQPLAEEFKGHMEAKSARKSNPLGHLQRVNDMEVPSVLKQMHDLANRE